jgi:hypothetical protein
MASSGVGSWTEKVLHRFKGGADGAFPFAGLVMDANGALYGTTAGFPVGCQFGCGTVFELTPPATGETGWTEKVLHRFKGGADGANPFADLIMDQNGALYGTTANGGGRDGTGVGTVFQLRPPAAGTGPWTEKVLYAFGAPTAPTPLPAWLWAGPGGADRGQAGARADLRGGPGTDGLRLSEPD